MRRLCLPLCLCALAASAADSRRFEFTSTTRLPAASGKLRVWIPAPLSDANQQISQLAIESPVPHRLYRDREYGNQYAYLETAAGQPVEVRMKMQVVRRENRVDPARHNGARPDPSKLARWLAADRRVPLDGLIASLSASETGGRATPLEKARSVYNYVLANMRYDKTGDGWGQGDAIFACNARRGNCTDFHALLIGMLRAVRIPARFEIGFSIPPAGASGELPGYHCWAQFWLEGAGWIPVDASEAWKNPARRDYFFGAHDQHRILFTRGRDIRLDPPQQGEPLNYFVYPYAEADGKPVTTVESRYWFRNLD